MDGWSLSPRRAAAAEAEAFIAHKSRRLLSVRRTTEEEDEERH